MPEVNSSASVKKGTWFGENLVVYSGNSLLRDEKAISCHTVF
jgi:hypothetical protein